MNNNSFDVPILLLAFNRPETICNVFDQIRKIRPETLYIFSDEAREDHPTDRDLVDTCRLLLQESQINWPCKVERWYPDAHFGKAVGVSSAISWAFETCDRLIILEENCLPHPTFFTYCQDLLDKYKSNQRVMHISGLKRSGEQVEGNFDHSFIHIGDICGWATWKRAWNKFDFWMELFTEAESGKTVKKLLGDGSAAKYWNDKFCETYLQEKKTSWYYQWQFALFVNNGLAAIPNVNLITNIAPDDEDNVAHNTELQRNLPWLSRSSKVPVVVNRNHNPYNGRPKFARRERMAKRIFTYVKSFILK